MASTPTKQLKVQIKSELRNRFADRGWTPRRGEPATFIAPTTTVTPPLSVEWNIDVDSYRYGGATVSGIATLDCTDIGQILMTFDDASLPDDILNFTDPTWRLRMISELDATTEGILLDPLGNYHKWLVDDEESLHHMTTELFAMIDGPLTDWITPRQSTTAFLDLCTQADDLSTPAAPRFRPTTLLAITAERIDLARRMVAERAATYGDADQTIANFERELAHRYPTYGPLQRS